ncbi:hypothetical protein GIB67_016281 [Kingdonia uniflora]|uniref:Uncharacterized protein n=1 Tax=Kingdonia uniflora TaxID=39325 RepID=A0A7J7M9B3_9MAGN|nr:hypothetical protein GIB67_016281 [Kingdonia uniflora]
MVMDQRLRGLGSLQIDNSTNPYQNIMKMFLSLNHSFNGPPCVVVPPDVDLGGVNGGNVIATSVDTPEDCEFNDTVLKYISQILMKEDMEEKSCMVQESLALQAAKKPFYEALGKNYPPLSDQHPFDSYPLPDQRGVEEASKFLPSGNNLIIDLENSRFLPREPKEESHFSRGVDEASNFLPNGNNPMLDLVIDLETNSGNESCPGEPKEEVLVKEEKKDETNHSPGGLRGKKNLHREDVEIEEGRSNKHSTVFAEETVRTEMFDKVLLCHGEKGERDLTNLRETWLAHCFADGLEARLAGTGSKFYIALLIKKMTAADILKASSISSCMPIQENL